MSRKVEAYTDSKGKVYKHKSHAIAADIYTEICGDGYNNEVKQVIDELVTIKKQPLRTRIIELLTECDKV
jgi:hypothetical protein